MPIAAIASSPDPRSAYDLLRPHGVHRQPEGWVATGAADVDAALTTPLLRVKPPPLAPGDAARLVSRMARFTEGEEHVRRRGLVAGLLPQPAALQEAAAARTAALLAAAGDVVDVVQVAREVPVAVLAAALGVAHVSALVGELCDALSPSLLPDGRCADDPARALVELLAPDEERTAAVVSLLFQSRDATAALISAAMLLDPADPPAVRVERALREQAPVQATTRVAAQDTPLGGAVVPAGDVVWVLLGAAQGEPPMTFGRGPHACPGAGQAVGIASGVLTALADGGWCPVSGDPVDWEPRPNLRMPARVLVRRA